MKIEVIATIESVSPVESGTNQAGNQWKKVEIVLIESANGYTSKLAVTAFNDRADLAATFVPGARVKASIRVESKEFTSHEGKKFMSTNLSLLSIEPEMGQYSPQQTAGGYYTPTAPPQPQYQQTAPPPQPQIQQMPVQGRLDLGAPMMPDRGGYPY